MVRGIRVGKDKGRGTGKGSIKGIEKAYIIGY
jgi:hypothetical protein